MRTEDFAARLKELRVKAGLTQKGLADAAGVSQSTVAALEQGAYDASFPTVVALAHALGVDCRAFLEPPAAACETAGPGRPPKAKAAPAGGSAVKRGRGKAKK
jgi:putative transcriptional regulator